MFSLALNVFLCFSLWFFWLEVTKYPIYSCIVYVTLYAVYRHIKAFLLKPDDDSKLSVIRIRKDPITYDACREWAADHVLMINWQAKPTLFKVNKYLCPTSLYSGIVQLPLLRFSVFLSVRILLAILPAWLCVSAMCWCHFVFLHLSTRRIGPNHVSLQMWMPFLETQLDCRMYI